MPHWLWWAPFAALTLWAGIVVFRLGWDKAHLSETEIINHYAAEYVARWGGEAKMTDCVARPGTMGDVWIMVICQSPVQAGVSRFGVDRQGHLVTADPAKATEPEA